MLQAKLYMFGYIIITIIIIDLFLVYVETVAVPKN